MIYVTDNLAYWHMPKTGGTTVGRIMVRIPDVGGICVQGPKKHGPPSEIPVSALQNRMLFGTVRDPWSWYLSFYQHCLWGMKDDLIKFGNGSNEFRDVLFGLTHPLDVEEMPDNFTVVWDVMQDHYEGALNNYLGSGLGLCSWTFRYVYGRPPRPAMFLDSSRLKEGMALLLNRPREMIEAIQSQNCASHRPQHHIPDAAKLYDEEMLGWVAKADAPLIETFGFTEPYGPARELLMATEDLRLPPSLR